MGFVYLNACHVIIQSKDIIIIKRKNRQVKYPDYTKPGVGLESTSFGCVFLWLC
jgi:hypothetical protein